MKAVFPCTGSIILTKKDIESLEAFYNTKLITSKIYEIYDSSEFMIQVKNFNYIPKNSHIVLDNVNLLDIQKLRSILNIDNQKSNTLKNTNDEINNYNKESLSDDTILSHPFFQTLKPLN